MGLASLYNAPADAVSLAEWSFAHAAHHADILRFIQAQKGRNLDSYVLDPIDPTNMILWEYQHQVMHNQMNAVLGIAGEALVGVRWSDPDALSEFIDQNASEHLRANTILGIP